MPAPPEPVRLLVPTQLPVANTNVYLLRGEETVLVDTGPHHPDSWDYLVRKLKDEGVATEDVDRILITHGHVDHYGQAGDLAEASGAEVWVPERDRDNIADFDRVMEERHAQYREVFLKTGLPEATIDLVGEFFAYLKTLGRPTPVHGTFRDGDVLRFGEWELEVLHTPGHSPGASCFLADGTLFAGDTVLKHITPNAAFGGADGVSVGMGDYLESLDRLTQLDVDRVLPGHGPPLDGVEEFVANYRALYRRRRATILQLLEADRTASDLVIQLFGTLPIEEVFLGLTEVLGHLEILEREGLVDAEERDGVIHYVRSE